MHSSLCRSDKQKKMYIPGGVPLDAVIGREGLIAIPPAAAEAPAAAVVGAFSSTKSMTLNNLMRSNNKF